MMAHEPSPRPEDDAAAEEQAADDQQQAADDQPQASDDQPQASDDEKQASDDEKQAAGDEEKAAGDQPADEEEEEDEEPEPDPETCRGVAICLDHFETAVLDGEFDGSDFIFYLEPAGVTQGPLRCERCPEGEEQKAGIFMTRAAWQVKTVFLSDGKNPERYELSFPKEFGYVKSLAHYLPESRKSAKYPWSKKY